MIRPLSLSLCLLLLSVTPGLAQTAPAKTDAPAAAQDASLSARLALAEKMAELTPPDDMVSAAVEALISRAPENDRATLRAKIISAFDRDAFRAETINAMAATFTEAELQKMVEYHSSPEAKSIAAKMPAYQRQVQPSLIRALDIAMMVARTGRPGVSETAPATPPPQ